MKKYFSFIFLLLSFYFLVNFGIESVSAEVISYADKIDETTFTRPTSSTFYKENFIIEIFNKINEVTGLNLKLTEYKYVLVDSMSSGAFSTSNNYTYYFSKGDFSGDLDNKLYISGGSFVRLVLQYNTSTFRLGYFTDMGNNYLARTGQVNYVGATNGTLSTDYALDFTEYTTELKFNETLFTNNSNFKEVCVNNYEKFGIVSKNYELVGEDTEKKVFSDRDFIWFKHGMSGIKTYLYDSNYEDNVNPITEDSDVYGMYATYYWLDSYRNIKNIFTHEDSIFSYMLEEKGYLNDDIFSYYDYTLHPFINYFNNIEEQYMFNVFYFENPKVFNIENMDSETPAKICFYVKNEYDVVIFQENEHGDITGDITILDDTKIEINTSFNKNNKDIESKFSGVTNFMTSMQETMNFISSLITSFYNSLPLILRQFILVVFILLIVILVMSIGGYK